MDEQELKQKLNSLIVDCGVTTLEDSNFLVLSGGQQILYERRRDEVEDLLIRLRLVNLYKQFELEATERENDYLKKLLQEENK